MLRTFVYHDNNWVEESEQLLLHDCVAFLDEEERTVYLWNGPKSTQKRLEMGYDSVTDLMMGLPDDSLQLTVLLDDIPDKIQNKIDVMFEGVRKERESQKRIFSSLISIRLYLIFSILALILPIFSLLNLQRFLFFPVSSGITAVTSTGFNTCFMTTRILTVITLIFLAFNVIIASYERDYKVAVLALIGVITCIGILLYLSQGIYLFNFQPGWTSTRYLILQVDLLAFFALNIFAVLLFAIPNILKLISFIRTYRRYIFLR